MVKKYKAKPLSEEKTFVGDGPIFDPKTGAMSWIDIDGCKFHVKYPDGKVCSVDVGKKVGSCMPLERSNGYLIAAADGLYTWENDELKKHVDLSGVYKKGQRSNDAKPDPKGRVFFGSLTDEGPFEQGGSLYCLDNGEIKVIEEHVGLSNGLCWNSDGTKFYYVDTMTAAVWEYDYCLETGSVSNKNMLFKLEGGLPDGLTIDADDNIWVGTWFGGTVECHSSKNGELLAVVEMDAALVTGCGFYGENLDQIFITTSYMNVDGEYDGCLFTCKVDAKGVKPDYAKI